MTEMTLAPDPAERPEIWTILKYFEPEMSKKFLDRYRPYQTLAVNPSKQPEISKYFDRHGLYQTESGRVRVKVRLAVVNEYGELRFLILPHLHWVPAERVELD